MEIISDTSLKSEIPHFVNPQELQKGKSISKKYILLGLVVGFLIVGITIFLTQKQTRELWQKRSSVFGQIGKDNPLAKKVEPVRSVQNPLTGVMYTEEESASWKDLRPLGVMINNHPYARPQAGLIDADFTYEIVAEGGITRFLAFYQSVLPDKVGPVRSTREYYLVLTKEMGDAMLMHHGYSPQAGVAIQAWKVRSLQNGGAPYWRENPRDVPIEHTLYANAKEVVKTGLSLGWEGKSSSFYVWQFKDSPSIYATMPSATKISYDFWTAGDFSASWVYDPTSNQYLRSMGFDTADKELPHLDELTKKQIGANNLIVQFATEDKIVGDEKNRLDYTLVGSGKGYVFLDGKVIEVTWSKASREERTKYYDMSGNEIKFNRGKFWVAILPDRNIENLKFSAPVN